MILKTTSFQTDDGEIHPSIEEAQKHELKSLIKIISGFSDELSESTSEFLINSKDKIIDLLTMKASSKPKARKINGAIKKRAAKKTATGELSEAEQAEVENL